MKIEELLKELDPVTIIEFKNYLTKEELKSALEDFGLKGKEIADDLYEKLETEKEELDTETRRKTRAFWLPVGFLLGVVATVIVQWFV